MGKATKSEIKKIIDDIDHDLEQIDEKLDKVRHLLDSVTEASEAGTNKRAEAVREPEKEQKQEKEEKQDKKEKKEKQEKGKVAESAEKDVYGSCPLCGSPLLVLGRAPLVVECSNVKCRNTFTPK